MSKAFVITKTSFNYNDEVYYTENPNAGTPAYIFSDKKQAEEKAALLNGKELRECNPMEFGYSFDEITSLDQSEFEERISEILDCDITLSDEYDPPWKINCRGKKHRLYRAIGEDCPCQPAPGEYSWSPAIWPKGATDKQLEVVLRECFDLIPSFYVVHEIEIVETDGIEVR